MTITQKSIKILWSAAAGVCSYPDCHTRLTDSGAGDQAPYTLGEMAHICGDKPNANRHDPQQTDQQRDDYSNLILLCPTHHTLIDRKENEKNFQVELLHKFKSDHEKSINERINNDTTKRKDLVAKEIFALLSENHQTWLNYGPASDFARKNPYNDSAYAVWLSERLSTIIPNNRGILQILQGSTNLFHSDEQEIIAKFRLHARSYERWVTDEISYDGVIRFPTEFAEMIGEIADGGA